MLVTGRGTYQAHKTLAMVGVYSESLIVMLGRGKEPVGVSCHRRLEAYLGRLYGYAYSLSEDREAARDLVQDCALKALSAAQVPYDEAAYRAWLFRILRNTFLDQRKRNGEVLIGFNELEPANLNGELWECDDRLVTVLTVRLGMTRLSTAHREVISLIDIVGFSYAESADFLKVPVGTVMSRLSRARQALLLAIQDNNVQPLPQRSKRVAG